MGIGIQFEKEDHGMYVDLDSILDFLDLPGDAVIDDVLYYDDDDVITPSEAYEECMEMTLDPLVQRLGFESCRVDSDTGTIFFALLPLRSRKRGSLDWNRSLSYILDNMEIMNVGLEEWIKKNEGQTLLSQRIDVVPAEAIEDNLLWNLWSWAKAVNYSPARQFAKNWTMLKNTYGWE